MKAIYLTIICITFFSGFLHGQTLEIHQIAVGNADAGLIIVRDTTKVMNLIKYDIARSLLNNQAYSTKLKQDLNIINFDAAPPQWATSIFIYFLSLQVLTPGEVNTLNGQLNNFNPQTPNIPQLKATLNNGSVQVPNSNYGTALKLVNDFTMQYAQVFAGNNPREIMTLFVRNIAKDSTRAKDFSLVNTVKHAVLIDVGRLGSADYDAGNKVFNYLSKYGVTRIDKFILSHYHNDHYGGFKELAAKFPPGFIGTVYEPGYQFKKPALERLKRKPGSNKKVKVPTLVATNYVIPLANALGCADVSFGNCPKRHAVVPNNVSLDLTSGIKMECVAGNTFVYGDPNFTTLTRANTRKPNDNDYSLAWVLHYNDFRYFTGGDLSGFSDGGYNDIETDLAKQLNNVPGMAGSSHICALKVSHHGSRFSSNEKFLDTIEAKVAIIPNGGKDVHGNPDQQVFHRLAQTDNQVLNMEKIYTLGMMPDSVVYKTRTVRRRPVYDRYLPWASIQRDLVADGSVTVAGNVVLIVDDYRASNDETEFIVAWDGEVNYAPDKNDFVRQASVAGWRQHVCKLH